MSDDVAPEPALAEIDCAGGYLSTSLMKAAVHGDAKLVSVGLECTASNIDAVDASGRTALMIACVNGHADVARALMEAGCDLSAADGEGRSAERLAEAHGHAAVAAAVRAEEHKRAKVWAAIMGAPSVQQPSAGLRAAELAPPDDVMAKMAAASLPVGAREAPF